MVLSGAVHLMLPHLAGGNPGPLSLMTLGDAQCCRQLIGGAVYANLGNSRESLKNEDNGTREVFGFISTLNNKNIPFVGWRKF